MTASRHGLRSPRFHMAPEGEGRNCESCRLATIAALTGPAIWIRNGITTLTRVEWLAVLVCLLAVGAAWSGN